MIYLDSAATTLQKPPSVPLAMASAVRGLASPGRGGHRPAMAAAETAFSCRQLAAELFHVPGPEQVVFTFNATHGLNIAIKTLARPNSQVVISGYEHNAVTRPLHALGIRPRVASSPLFDPAAALEAFRRELERPCDLVICNHVSNVFGTVLPVEQIAQLCRERGIPLIVDASQSAGVLPIDFQSLGAAFIAMPGHKGLYGPQGTGLLLCGMQPHPVMEGGTGSQSLIQDMPELLPDRLEAGTHNMPGIAGLAEGIRFVLEQGTRAICQQETVLVQRSAQRFAQIPGVRSFVSDRPEAQTGVLSFLIDGMDVEDAGERLGSSGFALRAGLHCAPLAHRSAGTLDTGTLRASVSVFNTAQEIDRLADAVSQLALGL